MKRGICLVVGLLLIVSLLAGGCAAPQEEPVDADLPEDEENDKPWTEANQLEPEKKAILIIEGMEEEVTLQLQVSSLYPYAIYLDEDRYHKEEREDRDYILPRADVEPEVFMAIWHRQGVTVAEALAEIEEQLQEEYADVLTQEEVENPLPAYYLYAASGNARNDTVDRYYLVQDFRDGVYVIQQRLFTEAVEGHGARFDGLLEEFYAWHFEKGEFIRP